MYFRGVIAKLATLNGPPEFDLVFGSNSELRAVVEFYAFDESRQRFIKIASGPRSWMLTASISKIPGTLW